MLTERQRKARSNLARIHVGADPDNPGTATRIAEAKREYRVATVEARIEELLASAPPITDEQRQRLTGLLAAPEVPLTFEAEPGRDLRSIRQDLDRIEVRLDTVNALVGGAA